MVWSEQTEEALRHWLGRETWHTGHHYDDARFSVFVASVWNDEHSIWDEALAREKIREKAIELHPKFNRNLAQDEAKNRVSEGTVILKFLLDVRKKGQFSLLSP